MRLLLFISGLLLLQSFCLSGQASEKSVDFAIVIHGGAGNIVPDYLDAEQQAAIHAKLQEALDAGYAILEQGGSSLDAVTASIRILEDSPLFNAGRGAVFNADGEQEMDASIMDGRDQNAGAVAGVAHIKNPIEAARLVMEQSKHVMLSGEGAEQFAQSAELELVEKSYFRDERRYEQWKRAQKREQQKQKTPTKSETHEKHGTVGAVALDKNGNIAAGTSTGGMTNKRYGRIGDSPVIGAGTYANNATCGVSCTGHGEYFIRNVVAYDVSARMAYGGLSLATAARQIIQEKLKSISASGGLIALDKEGNIVIEFNTPGMFRGYRKSGETAVTQLFAEEE